MNLLHQKQNYLNGRTVYEVGFYCEFSVRIFFGLLLWQICSRHRAKVLVVDFLRKDTFCETLNREVTSKDCNSKKLETTLTAVKKMKGS